MSDVLRKARIREQVRKRYQAVAMGGSSCCAERSEPAAGCCGESAAPASACCCGGADESTSCCGGQEESLEARAARYGYSVDELLSVPEGSNLWLGCGNPGAIAALQPGEVVLDLGSGAGFDCFLAAKKVGASGRVIGVDMTPEMVSKARANAARAGAENVEFRLGEIEHLPVADNSVDVIISNCVVNLSPDKPAVFREALRVLKPGGRLAISDTVTTIELPEAVRRDLDMWSACISGSESVAALEAMLAEAGFEDIRITPHDESREMIREWAPGHGIEEFIVSAAIEGKKPRC